LVEAIFEVFAESEPGAPPIDVAPLRRKLPEFQGAEELAQALGVEFQVSPEAARFRAVAGPTRVRLWDCAHRRAVQLGAQMCALNILAGAYEHFDRHLDTMRTLFEVFLTVAAPKRLAWAGQRYLNLVQVAGEDVSEYFDIYPKLPAALRGHRLMSLQVHGADFEGGSVLTTLGFRGLRDGAAQYVIDVWARSVGELAPDVETLIDWQRRAHPAIVESFEMAVSDKSRIELFKGKRP
jgi:uncharacterized protein (TIGR04255 family)